MKAIILAAILALSGCATSSGVQISQDQLKDFRVGVTTEAEVLKSLGVPTTVLNMQEGKMLIYSYYQTKVRAESFIPIVGAFVGGTDSHGGSVTIFLNPDGTIKSFTSDVTRMSARLN